MNSHAEVSDLPQYTVNDINILTASAADLQRLLVAGEYSITDLVKLYLDQIEAHNKNGVNLNAVIMTASRGEILALTEQLDRERAEKGFCGPLHGIPVLGTQCKNCFC